MAQAGSGAIRGRWPDDYEGEIPRKRDGSLWQEERTNSEGEKEFVPIRIVVRLRLTAARQVYKRAKRMVA